MTDSKLEKPMVAQVVPDRDRELNLLEEAATAAIAQARELGADSCEVEASIHFGLSANVRMGEVETLEHSRDRGLGISVYLDHSKGHASSADLRPQTVRDAVARAYDIARFTQADKCNGLAPAERLATEFPDLDLWHPRPLDANAAIERALECEAAGLDNDAISNSEGAAFSSHYGLSVYANSLGFVGRSDGTHFSQSCALVAGKKNEMQRDYWYDSKRAESDLESAAQTGREAARRTVMRLGARNVPTCEVPVLFAAPVARGLVGHLLAAVSGGALYRNASFLKDQAGQQLFPGWMQMTEYPHLPRGPASAAFDAEGVATRQRHLIDGGVLTGYVLGSYSARRLGLETTGNAGGVHNLRVLPGTSSDEELLRQMGTGLLVTEVMGQGVSLVTGDYSRGASGFWVEHGEVQHAVDEVTVAGNLKDIFRRIEAVGAEVDERGGVQSGPILVGRMTVAGS